MFVKNDNSFKCEHCGSQVEKLGYTSRDHCNHCLYSLHVDVTPGDRENKCKGLLKPVNIVTTKNKTQIEYICLSCGQRVRNIVAEDDNQEVILNIIREYAKNGGK